MINFAHVDSIFSGKKRPVERIKAEPKPKPVKQPKPKPEPKPVRESKPVRQPYSVAIYAVRHVPSGRAYIGMSKNPEARLRNHLGQLRLNRHPSRILQAAWKEDEFEFIVLERDIDALFAQAREQAWMWRYEGKLLNLTCHAWPDMAPGARDSLRPRARSRSCVKSAEVAGALPVAFRKACA